MNWQTKFAVLSWEASRGPIPYIHVYWTYDEAAKAAELLRDGGRYCVLQTVTIRPIPNTVAVNKDDGVVILSTKQKKSKGAPKKKAKRKK